MKKATFSILALLLIVLATISGCKKDDAPAQEPAKDQPAQEQKK
jgi:hypothetical protein